MSIASDRLETIRKQVEQHLERQAINARLRSREHDRFSQSLRD